jgi:hypothetical protein
MPCLPRHRRHCQRTSRFDRYLCQSWGQLSSLPVLPKIRKRTLLNMSNNGPVPLAWNASSQIRPARRPPRLINTLAIVVPNQAHGSTLVMKHQLRRCGVLFSTLAANPVAQAPSEVRARGPLRKGLEDATTRPTSENKWSGHSHGGFGLLPAPIETAFNDRLFMALPGDMNVRPAENTRSATF